MLCMVADLPHVVNHAKTRQSLTFSYFRVFAFLNFRWEKRKYDTFYVSYFRLLLVVSSHFRIVVFWLFHIVVFWLVHIVLFSIVRIAVFRFFHLCVPVTHAKTNYKHARRNQRQRLNWYELVQVEHEKAKIRKHENANTGRDDKFDFVVFLTFRIFSKSKYTTGVMQLYDKMCRIFALPLSSCCIFA